MKHVLLGFAYSFCAFCLIFSVVTGHDGEYQLMGVGIVGFVAFAAVVAFILTDRNYQDGNTSRS